ncbi:MAG TPA: glycosyltransferase [Flavobacterium sp.]|nr:glycosyltransferase [Flavobacterium sp.]
MIFLLLLLVVLIYTVTIAQLIHGFDRVSEYFPTQESPKTFFAIVVPFRNEARNLPGLLESFRKLNYPAALFEIILVDDFSEDESVKLVYNWRMENGEFQFTLLENIKISGSPKKDAIARAIPIIKNDWVITTDADCTVPENWLLTLDHYIQNHDASMLVGSVSYEKKKTFIRHFQQLDLTSLQGATIGSFGMGLGFMCNGANFCYRKSLFLELGGFAGNNNTASGDDVFLLQKAVAQFPEKVHYLKSHDNIVQTKALDNWADLFQQRVRWASKTDSYQSVFGKDLALIVFFGNVAVLVALVLAVLKVFAWQYLAALCGIKFLVDTVLLYKTNKFLSKKRMRFLFLSAILYPFFSVAVALYAMAFGYVWKGRKFKS